MGLDIPAGYGSQKRPLRVREVRMNKLARTLSVLFVLGALAQAQTVDFELRTFPESPVIFADSANTAIPGVPRRQLVAIKNDSKKSVAAVLFEQTLAIEGKRP